MMMVVQGIQRKRKVILIVSGFRDGNHHSHAPLSVLNFPQDIRVHITAFLHSFVSNQLHRYDDCSVLFHQKLGKHAFLRFVRNVVLVCVQQTSTITTLLHSLTMATSTNPITKPTATFSNATDTSQPPSLTMLTTATHEADVFKSDFEQAGQCASKSGHIANTLATSPDENDSESMDNEDPSPSGEFSLEVLLSQVESKVQRFERYVV